MSEEPTETQDSIPLEPKAAKPTLSARFRLIGILAIIIAIFWVVLNYIAPSPFMNSTNANQKVIMPFALENQQLDTPEPNKTQENNENVVEDAAVSDQQTKSPQDVALNKNEQAAVENAIESSANNESLTTSTISAEHVPAESTTEAAVIAATNVDEAATRSADNTAETKLIAAQLELLNHTVTDKDQKISTLKCALQIQTSAHQPDIYGMTLNQCYAVMVNAGISQGDIKLLTDASHRQGVPDRDEMSRTFQSAIAPSLRVHEEAHVEESGWYKALRQRITDSFIIRKTGWQDGDSTEAIIGRAESYISKSRLNKAYDEIQKLSDNAKKPFKDWLEMVEVYHTQKRVTDALIQASESEKAESRYGR